MYMMALQQQHSHPIQAKQVKAHVKRWRIRDYCKCRMKENPKFKSTGGFFRLLYCVTLYREAAFLSEDFAEHAHLVSGAEPVHGADLVRGEGLAEEVDGRHLPAEHALLVHLGRRTDVAPVERLPEGQINSI